MILSTLKYQTTFQHPKSVILPSDEDIVLSTLTLCYSWYLVFLLHLTRTVQELIALHKTPALVCKHSKMHYLWNCVSSRVNHRMKRCHLRNEPPFSTR